MKVSRAQVTYLRRTPLCGLRTQRTITPIEADVELGKFHKLSLSPNQDVEDTTEWCEVMVSAIGAEPNEEVVRMNAFGTFPITCPRPGLIDQVVFPACIEW